MIKKPSKSTIRGGVSRTLESWFLREQRVLPWREDPSPYRVWVSEIMLQQTQVKTVLPYFERFMGRFPTVEKLAKAPSEKVLEAWAGLGYYSRARNLHSAAKLIVQGGFPETLEGWLELPGVGRYTAGAVLSIAYGQPTAILDGNVERVLSRWLLISRGDSDSVYRERLWNESQRVLDEAVASGVRTSDFNQALMELGAMICTPKKPACLLCPVREFCSASREGRVDEFPNAKKKTVWKEVREARVGILDSRGRVLLRAGDAGAKWRAGLWDLPSEEEVSSLKGLGLKSWFSEEQKYVVTNHKVKRKISWMCAGSGAEKKTSASEFRWVDPQEPKLPVGSPVRKALLAVARRLEV